MNDSILLISDKSLGCPGSASRTCSLVCSRSSLVAEQSVGSVGDDGTSNSSGVKTSSGSTCVSGSTVRQGLALSNLAFRVGETSGKACLSGGLADALTGSTGKTTALFSVDLDVVLCCEKLAELANSAFLIARLARHSTQYPVFTSGDSTSGMMIGAWQSTQRITFPMRLDGTRIWHRFGQ